MGGTYAGNAVSCAAALAVLDVQALTTEILLKKFRTQHASIQIYKHVLTCTHFLMFLPMAILLLLHFAISVSRAPLWHLHLTRKVFERENVLANVVARGQQVDHFVTFDTHLHYRYPRATARRLRTIFAWVPVRPHIASFEPRFRYHLPHFNHLITAERGAPGTD